MGAAASYPVNPNERPQVICIGYQRTGTFSTSLALEELGYGPCSHGGSQLVCREDDFLRKFSHMYDMAEKGSRAELLKAVEAVSKGFLSISDAPYNQFVEELVELYPEAKFVLLTRDQEAWWKSIEPVFQSAQPTWLSWYLLPAPGWRWLWKIKCGIEKR